MESHKIYVGNLDHSITEEDIRELFSEYGNICSIKMESDNGFAFVEYNTLDEAENAIKGTSGKEFFSRTLKVEDAKPVLHHIPRNRT